jgi:hypothetical protein
LGANAWKREVRSAGRFQRLDSVLDLSVLAVELFEHSEIVAGLVGDEALEAMPVDVAEG